jgi:hypothetical protein
MQPSLIATNEERQPFQFSKTSSSTNSIVSPLQRAPSFTPARSKSRGQAGPQTVYSSSQDALSSSFKPANSPESQRRPSTGHSRSNSLSGTREGLGNLNRWSRSTASSKESNHQRSHSRRMSFGAQATFSFGPAPSDSPPRKLQKNCPATANSPSRQGEGPRPPFQSALNPPSLLPAIVPLPSLQTSVNNSSPLAGSLTPSTSGILSAALRSNVPDCKQSLRQYSFPTTPIFDRLKYTDLINSQTLDGLGRIQGRETFPKEGRPLNQDLSALTHPQFLDLLLLLTVGPRSVKQPRKKDLPLEATLDIVPRLQKAALVQVVLLIGAQNSPRRKPCFPRLSKRQIPPCCSTMHKTLRAPCRRIPKLAHYCNK